ncbi:S41 family peptidase [uncultured Dokdonia sp.]|uniref:S41 family peptidase n=1 Tax=uncultured Dokdonia sp. TaxID=575653 RepID=UPI00261BE694|nr:S41 family peptidase [uncultured Dokdonia sp.]
MKKMKFLVIGFLASLTMVNCSDDLDDVIRPASNLEISQFIYRGLNFWSLYKEDVPDLANDRFTSDAELNDFLDDFESPEATFEALLSPNDRFSILRDDYIELENALSGIRRSTGMRFALFNDPSGNGDVFGLVRYVINNSPAQDAGVQRGMIFTGIDGIALTSDSDFDAIFGQDTYTLNLADYDADTELFTLNGTDITLNQVELTINPIHTARTLTVEGRQIGYLHYTGFTNEFDDQLNNAFAQFQAEGVTDLILDIRYNGGGSIETANDLSSMITGQFNGELFIRQTYNEDRNPDNQFDRLFNSNIGSGNDGAGINSLNLTRVYVITTGSSASASELILSGLDPYIEVIQVGTTTAGKFEGSFLLYDSPSFRRTDAINPNHRYVMLPLVLRSENANGLTDYFDGFTPDIVIGEDFANLGQLGVQGEPLLDAVINEILLGRSAAANYNTRELPAVFFSDQNDILYQRMLNE